jgi:hypothetical protein
MNNFNNNLENLVEERTEKLEEEIGLRMQTENAHS